MKKAIIAIVALMAVLAVIYLAGSWYFSGLIVKFTPRTLEQQQAEHGAPADYGLPAPEEVTIPGDGVALAGWYITSQLPAALCQRLHLTDWGAKHAGSIDDDFAAYQAQFDEFLSVFVSGFAAAADAQ